MSEHEPLPVDIVGRVTDLPDYAFGPRGLVWWGTFGFMAIEGAGFLLAVGAYFYLLSQARTWPPYGDLLPGLGPATIFTAVSLASMLPNLWLARKAKAMDDPASKWGCLAMTAIGVVLLAIRAYEFPQLNVRWDHDAYGSLVWMLLVLHTTHVITDVGDTAVLTWWFFTHQPGPSQYSDVDDNAGYWSFVVVSWLPIYALIYWAPRWL